MTMVLSIAGLGCMVAASLTKGNRMTAILILVCLGNALVATGYLLDGAINGAISCYIGAVQTGVNSWFERRCRALPIWLIVLYAAAFIGCNLAAGFSWMGLLAITASLTFILCIGQKSGAKYRFWTVVNMVLWILYDLLTVSYGALLTHAVLLVFTVTGMIVHDRKKQAE